MTTPPPGGTSTEEPRTTGPRVTGEQMRDLGRLRRSSSERKVAGVAGGIARHLDIDPLLVRIVLVVLVFFGGAGMILYGAGWLLLPDDHPGDRPMVPLDDRSRAVALWIAVGLAAASAIGDSVGGWDVPWPAAPVAIVALIVLSRSRRRRWTGHHDRPGPAVTPTERAAGAADGTDAGHRWPTWQEPASDQPRQETYEETHYETRDWRTDWRTQRDEWLSEWHRHRDDWVWRRDPRKRGPVLFGFTLALAALGVGILLTAHLAGADIAPSAYPATVAGACGLMLVVSAFYGRGGGLLLVGLVATAAMVVASGDGSLRVGRADEQPTSAAAVHDSYDFGVGELRLDLTDVHDRPGLDGRTIHLDSRIGRILVIVPRTGLAVDVNATVDAAGETELFGDQHDGSAVHSYDGGNGAPHLTIDADLTFGQIEVTTEETP